jgi:hypothetical protein
VYICHKSILSEKPQNFRFSYDIYHRKITEKLMGTKW